MRIAKVFGLVVLIAAIAVCAVILWFARKPQAKYVALSATYEAMYPEDWHVLAEYGQRHNRISMKPDPILSRYRYLGPEAVFVFETPTNNTPAEQIEEEIAKYKDPKMELISPAGNWVLQRLSGDVADHIATNPSDSANMPKEKWFVTDTLENPTVIFTAWITPIDGGKYETEEMKALLLSLIASIRERSDTITTY